MAETTTVTVSKADLAEVLTQAPRTAAWRRLADVLLRSGWAEERNGS
jgi:hypothetical protein